MPRDCDVATRLRRVERLMGTVFSFDVRGDVDPRALDEAVDWLRWVEATFSVFLATSEVTRIGRGLLGLDDAAPEVREVLLRCDELRAGTGAAFDHRPIDRPGRPLDPSAFVKGWSVDHAATILRLGGATALCISGGGDVRCGGRPEPGRGWRVGIRHPDDPAAVAAVLEVTDASVATSGRYERGDHVWGRDRTAMRSVTVVGPELGLADALATATLAEGIAPPPWFRRFPGHDLLVVTHDRRVRWTAGLDGALVRPAQLAQPASGSDARISRS